MWERLSFASNIRTESVAGRRMLKPSCILHCISSQINLTIYRVNAKAWGSFARAVSSARLDHGGTVWTGIPSSTYEYRRSADRCLTASGSVTSVFLSLKTRKDRRYGVQCSYLVVALDVATRSPLGDAACGG